MSYEMYGKELPTFDDIYHHKYVKRERIGDKWRYFYDTKITGKAYKRQANDYSKDAAYNKDHADYWNKQANETVSRLRNLPKLQKQFDTGISQIVKNWSSGQRGVDPRSAQYQNVESGNAKIRNNIHNNVNSQYYTTQRAKSLTNDIRRGSSYQSASRAYDAKAAKATHDYYTKSLAGRISKAGMDIKKIINAIKNPPEVKKYKDVKTGISYKEKTYKDANGKVKEVRTTMSGAPITEKQKKAAKERKTKATAQQLANLARIDSIQQKYGDAMRKSYNGQNINDVRKKNTKPTVSGSKKVTTWDNTPVHTFTLGSDGTTQYTGTGKAKKKKK